MSWGRSPIVGQPLMWMPSLPPTGYWLPPPPADHPGQSSSTPLPPLGQGYWPLSWAPPDGGQAPPWGTPLWTTLTPHPHQPSSSPLTERHLCLLSIVTFIMQANVERLSYSSIIVFKRPSSARCDFTDAVLNMGGSDEGDGGGTSNDATP
jgi:hypothetical protein